MKQQGNSSPTKPNNPTMKASNHGKAKEIITNEFKTAMIKNDE
jgi:hypothetical protein